MSDHFTLRIRVRYAECDPQNIVFNARYADYIDMAATEFMRALIGGYQKLLEQGVDNKVINLNIDWFASAHFDDVLDLQTKIVSIGNTSFKMQVAIIRPQDGVHIATGTVTYVMVDSVKYQKISIPQHLRELFDVVPKTSLIDQSGTAG